MYVKVPLAVENGMVLNTTVRILQDFLSRFEFSLTGNVHNIEDGNE